MADVAPTPFINFGLSQEQQAQAGASANLENQQANVASQQAQQQAMQTELMQRSMPMYRQAIDEARAYMAGTPAANAMANSSGTSQAQAQRDPFNPAQLADQSSGQTPFYEDPGQVADIVRQQNFVQPFTSGEQRMFMTGATLAAMPGAAANPMLLNMAKYQNQFRVQNQSRTNALRSNQLYDALTAASTADDPLSALGAIPGQQGVAAQIAKNNPGDTAAQTAAAKRYAQMAAYNYHQFSGMPTKMENGVEIDTTRGEPVTGQQQVLTGISTEQRAKIYQDGLQHVEVTLKNGQKVSMLKWQAPKPFGWGGITPSRMVMMENQAMQQPTFSNNMPKPGATTWDSPTAPGNTTGAADAAAGNASPQSLPANAPPMAPPGAHAQVAVGAQLRQLNAAQPVKTTAESAPSPTQPMQDLPEYGTPAYSNRMSAALSDAAYRSQWAGKDLNQPGMPQTGADTGITNYQNGKKALAQSQSEISSSADSALQNFRAAKMIFDSTDGLMTGPIGALEQRIAAGLGVDWRTVDGRQQISKYLTQAAVSQLKQMYGSQPAAFETKVNLEQAFPNLKEMSPKAVRGLIDSQISQAQYLKQSAARSTAYLNKGNDPYQFGTWNSMYFPRAHLLDQEYGGVQPKSAPTVGAIEKGYKFLGGDPSKPASWQKVQ
jgi:hypothetical protein